MLCVHLLYIFFAPVLKSSIIPRTSGSFYWRIVLEANTWALGMLIANGVLGRYLDV